MTHTFTFWFSLVCSQVQRVNDVQHEGEGQVRQPDDETQHERRVTGRPLIAVLVGAGGCLQERLLHAHSARMLLVDDSQRGQHSEDGRGLDDSPAQEVTRLALERKKKLVHPY